MTISKSADLHLTYIGGPTLLLEYGGLRLLTDPTFDPAGTEYPTNIYTLRKRLGPALRAEGLGKLDAVLLSHDHHFDNLDNAGRAVLSTADRVLTTYTGAARLGGNAMSLSPWETTDLAAPSGRILRVTGTPARHGPVDGDRGPVTGFFLSPAEHPGTGIYISGDTVWYEGVAEIADRYSVKVAVLFLGAAVVPEVGRAHLTMTAEEAVRTAHAMADALIVPVHFEGWEHFSESQEDIQRTFVQAGLADRLVWLKRGVRQAISFG